ncbi:actin, putative [Entamoeba invadens IP1]|uniref:Actin, putative n=1 Tax=Entamoeba invadens IP1 TaxID=370355 RepID=A0A0A1TZV8_ENTIV|nr:actin, putative [Entamoeba invadens IP1]ELP84178.1 actin, putative [Entamoeba invadens IP1]|eukprot:XP_004183524.1 actin, putative [Entamoeba invadens IP1]
MKVHKLKRVSCLELAGQDVRDSIEKIANQKGFIFKEFNERLILDEIKENMCYIAQDFEKKEKEANKLEKIYKLLDKKEIKLGAERFEYTEQLFNPNKYGKDMNGIAIQVNDSLMQIEPNLKTELYRNIVLAGGSTMMTGFVERFNTEFTKFAPESMKLILTAPPNGDIAVYMGGKIFASLSTFKSACVSFKDYDECGPDITEFAHKTFLLFILIKIVFINLCYCTIS